MWQIRNSLITRINKHFESRGGQGSFTMLFSNFPSQTQTEILTLLNVSPEKEKPLIGSYIKDRYCLLLTTKKLLWSTNNNIQFIYLENIVSVNTLIKFMNPKNDFYRLFITTKDNQKYEIDIEAKRPFSGMLNVLMLIIGLRKE